MFTTSYLFVYGIIIAQHNIPFATMPLVIFKIIIYLMIKLPDHNILRIVYMALP